jgi:hypothetical protein
MTQHGFRLVLVAVGLAAGFAASGATAQEYRTDLATRCAPVEVRYLSGPDPCQPHYAVFGITGPTIVTRDSIDVEATGSIAPRSARHDPPSNAGTAK